MSDISRELAAKYVLRITLGDPFETPGHFFDALIRAALLADRGNRHLLALGFPNVMWAVTKYKDEHDGYQQLRLLAGCPFPPGSRGAAAWNSALVQWQVPEQPGAVDEV